MAVTLTVAELSAQLRVGETEQEAALVTRILATAKGHVEQEAPHAPEWAQNEAAIRYAGWMYDRPPAPFGTAYANGLRASGALEVLTRHIVKRAISVDDAIGAIERAAGAENPVIRIAIAGDQLVVTYANGTEDEYEFPAGAVDEDEVNRLLKLRYTDAEKNKLAGIEVGATQDQTAGEIRDALQSLTDIARLDASAVKNLPQGGGGGDGATAEQVAAIQANTVRSTANAAAVRQISSTADARAKARYTDAEKQKLAGIEQDATADQTAAEIIALLEATVGNARLDASAIKNLPSGGSQGGGGGGIPIVNRYYGGGYYQLKDNLTSSQGSFANGNFEQASGAAPAWQGSGNVIPIPKAEFSNKTQYLLLGNLEISFPVTLRSLGEVTLTLDFIGAVNNHRFLKEIVLPSGSGNRAIAQIVPFVEFVTTKEEAADLSLSLTITSSTRGAFSQLRDAAIGLTDFSMVMIPVANLAGGGGGSGGGGLTEAQVNALADARIKALVVDAVLGGGAITTDGLLTDAIYQSLKSIGNLDYAEIGSAAAFVSLLAKQEDSARPLLVHFTQAVSASDEGTQHDYVQGEIAWFPPNSRIGTDLFTLPQGGGGGGKELAEFTHQVQVEPPGEINAANLVRGYLLRFGEPVDVPAGTRKLALFTATRAYDRFSEVATVGYDIRLPPAKIAFNITQANIDAVGGVAGTNSQGYWLPMAIDFLDGSDAVLEAKSVRFFIDVDPNIYNDPYQSGNVLNRLKAAEDDVAGLQAWLEGVASYSDISFIPRGLPGVDLPKPLSLVLDNWQDRPTSGAIPITAEMTIAGQKVSAPRADLVALAAGNNGILNFTYSDAVITQIANNTAANVTNLPVQVRFEYAPDSMVPADTVRLFLPVNDSRFNIAAASLPEAYGEWAYDLRGNQLAGWKNTGLAAPPASKTWLYVSFDKHTENTTAAGLTEDVYQPTTWQRFLIADYLALPDAVEGENVGVIITRESRPEGNVTVRTRNYLDFLDPANQSNHFSQENIALSSGPARQILVRFAFSDAQDNNVYKGKVRFMVQ